MCVRGAVTSVFCVTVQVCRTIKGGVLHPGERWLIFELNSQSNTPLPPVPLACIVVHMEANISSDLNLDAITLFITLLNRNVKHQTNYQSLGVDFQVCKYVNCLKEYTERRQATHCCFQPPILSWWGVWKWKCHVQYAFIDCTPILFVMHSRDFHWTHSSLADVHRLHIIP